MVTESSDATIALANFFASPAKGEIHSSEFDVIPAHAGTHVDLGSWPFLKCKASTRPAGERVTFFACAKKGNQRNTLPAARLPGILPSRCASRLRGSLSAHPCARNELARLLRATLRAFPPPTRRATGAPFGRHPAAEEARRR